MKNGETQIPGWRTWILFYYVLLLVQPLILLRRRPTEILRGQGIGPELEPRTSDLQLSSMHPPETHTDIDEQRPCLYVCWRRLSLTSICCEVSGVFHFCSCFSTPFDLDMLSETSCTIADLSLNLGEKLACLSVVSGLSIMLFLGATLEESENQ